MTQNGPLTHPQDLDAPLRLAAQRKINSYRQQYADRKMSRPGETNREHLHPHARQIFASSFSTGPPGDRGALQCHWNANATQQLGHVPFSPRGLQSSPEEQSRTRGGQSRSVADRVERRQLQRIRILDTRSFTRSPSSSHAPFTQSPFPRVH